MRLTNLRRVTTKVTVRALHSDVKIKTERIHIYLRTWVKVNQWQIERWVKSLRITLSPTISYLPYMFGLRFSSYTSLCPKLQLCKVSLIPIHRFRRCCTYKKYRWMGYFYITPKIFVCRGHKKVSGDFHIPVTTSLNSISPETCL